MHNLEIDIGVTAYTNRKELSWYLVKKKDIDLQPFNFYVFYDEMKYKEHIRDFRIKLLDKLYDYIEGDKK